MAIGAYFPASTSETTIGNVEVQTLTTTDLLAPGDWLLVFQSGEGAGNPTSGQAVPLPVQVGSTVVLDVGGTHPTDASAGAGNAHTIENVQSGSFSDTGWIDLGYTAGGYTAGGVGSPGRNHAGVWGKLLTTADDGTDGAGTVGDFTVRVTVDGSSPNGRQLTTAILVVTGSTGDVAADITTTTNIALSSMTNNRSTSGTAQTQIEWFKPTDTSSTDGYHADAVGDDFIQIWYGSIPPDNAPNPTQAVSTGTRPTDQGNTGLGSTTAWPVPNQASPGDYGGTVTAFNQHAAFVYFDTTNSSSPGLDAWTTFAEFDALWTGSPARFAWEVGGANSSSGTDNAIWSYNTHSIIIKGAVSAVSLSVDIDCASELTETLLDAETLTSDIDSASELTVTLADAEPLASDIESASELTVTMTDTETLSSDIESASELTVTMTESEALTSDIESASELTVTLADADILTSDIESASELTVVLGDAETLASDIDCASELTVTFAAVASLSSDIDSASELTVTLADAETLSSDIESASELTVTLTDADILSSDIESASELTVTLVDADILTSDIESASELTVTFVGVLAPDIDSASELTVAFVDAETLASDIDSASELTVTLADAETLASDIDCASELTVTFVEAEILAPDIDCASELTVAFVDAETLAPDIDSASELTVTLVDAEPLAVDIESSSELTYALTGERTIEEVYDLAVKIDRLAQVIMALGLGGRRR